MGTCMVGWAHSRFGRLDGLGVSNMGGSAVASYVAILERAR